MEGAVVFVDGVSGAPVNNGDFVITTIADQDLTYIWTTTFPNATLENETTASPHLSIDYGTDPTVCNVEVEVCDSCLVCAQRNGIVSDSLYSILQLQLKVNFL